MKSIVMAAAALLVAGSTSAAEITWELGPTFGGAQGHLGILTNGALVDAVHLASSNSGSIVVDPSGLNISFRNINSPEFISSFTDPPNNIGDAGWSQVIRNFEWSGADVDAATFLTGLTVGASYQVQFFSGRSYPGLESRLLKFGDGLGHFSPEVSMGQNVFTSVVGTFVADANTQHLVFDDSTNNPSLSAYVLRNVSPVPEPQTWALLLAGLAAVGSLVRRRAG